MNHLALGATLALLTATSLGACDDDSSSSPSSTIRLNELLASSDTSEDWVELYNPGDSEVSLAGFELRDDNNFWIFPEGTIPAGGFVQVICDGSGVGGKASFKLSAKGEVVSVHAADGARLDQVVFSALQKETSWGRIPDGTGDWTALVTPSPGQPNVAGAPADGGLAADSGTTSQADVGSPDSTTSKPDSTTSKPDSTTSKPDSGTTSKPDSGKPDSGTSKPDAAKPDLGMADGGPVVDATS